MKIQNRITAFSFFHSLNPSSKHTPSKHYNWIKKSLNNCKWIVKR